MIIVKRKKFNLHLDKSHFITGKDVKRYNEIRDLLQAANIDYKYYIHSEDKAFLGPGYGTARTVVGDIGNHNKDMYEIKIKENDYSKASYIIRNR